MATRVWWELLDTTKNKRLASSVSPYSINKFLNLSGLIERYGKKKREDGQIVYYIDNFVGLSIDNTTNVFRFRNMYLSIDNNTQLHCELINDEDPRFEGAWDTKLDEAIAKITLRRM